MMVHKFPKEKARDHTPLHCTFKDNKDRDTLGFRDTT